ncbi:MAG TPA: hypothetical protein ENH28_03265 [Euryarchaeota archaeon]|nr:hypothetical protein [Euryarchaeota archaeon]
MRIPVIVAHGDCDGLISSALILQNIPEDRARIYYSSPYFLRDTICKAMLGTKADVIYIADLSPGRETIAASSIYSRAFWFDHHTIEPFEAPGNVILTIDSNAKSAARVVARYFKAEDEIVNIADQIDKNRIESFKAEQLRSLVGYLKKYTHGITFALKMRSLAISLAEKGLDTVLSDKENLECIAIYQNYLQRFSLEIEKKVKVHEIYGARVAIYTTQEFNPVYFITNKLKEHSRAPFNYIVVAVYRNQNNKTKLEFRTHTGEDVLSLAKLFSGGGHRLASGATVTENISEMQILKAIESLQKQ